MTDFISTLKRASEERAELVGLWFLYCRIQAAVAIRAREHVPDRESMAQDERALFAVVAADGLTIDCRQDAPKLVLRMRVVLLKAQGLITRQRAEDQYAGIFAFKRGETAFACLSRHRGSVVVPIKNLSMACAA